MASYHHVQYQKKTEDPILIKFSDSQRNRRSDRQTGRQTDESDFIGCCLTNVELPINRSSKYINNDHDFV